MGNVISTSKAISKSQDSEIDAIKDTITNIIIGNDPTDLIDTISINIKLKDKKQIAENIEYDNVKQYVLEIMKELKN